MEINLDDVRAAREEVHPVERKTFVFKGERFELPRQLPVELLERFASYLVLTGGGRVIPQDDGGMGKAIDELFAGCEVLLGGPEWQRFKRLGADLSDVLSLLTGVIRAYKLGETGTSAGTPATDEEQAAVLGESAASGSSSSDSGTSSRPIGNGSTDATSGESSMEEVSRSDVSAS